MAPALGRRRRPAFLTSPGREWQGRPPGRCKLQVTRTAGRHRRTRRPHWSGPGIGNATPPGRCSAPWTACYRQTRTGRSMRPHSRRPTPGANGHGPRRDLATLQSTVPLANLGGRRATCKGHAPTYTSYTAGGHQPRVYNASLVTIRLNAERMPVRLTRSAPKISALPCLRAFHPCPTRVRSPLRRRRAVRVRFLPLSPLRPGILGPARRHTAHLVPPAGPGPGASSPP